jgi:hypothetical protein
MQYRLMAKWDGRLCAALDRAFWYGIGSLRSAERRNVTGTAILHLQKTSIGNFAIWK